MQGAEKINYIPSHANYNLKKVYKVILPTVFNGLIMHVIFQRSGSIILILVLGIYPVQINLFSLSPLFSGFFFSDIFLIF